VYLDLCLCEDVEECFEDALEGGFENEKAERFDDVVERIFDDDFDEDLDVLECLLPKVGVSETLSDRD
jgi:hypothetical protein